MNNCRCGWNNQGDHPCHAKNYSCGKSATQRFYNPRAVALAGMQMKFSIKETWACDDCWRSFSETLKNQ